MALSDFMNTPMTSGFQNYDYLQPYTSGNSGLGSALSPSSSGGLTSAGQIMSNAGQMPTADNNSIWGSLGSALTGDQGAGLLGLGQLGLGAYQTFINNPKLMKMQQKALQDQMMNSRMQRDLAASQYSDQQRVRGSLASAFGGSRDRYESEANRFDKYKG